jgi:hypothetical protein
MTYKKHITYSQHALDMMEERGIRQSQVRWIMAQGRDDRAYLNDPAPNERCRRDWLGEREARVIWIEGGRGRYVITIMWVE